LDLVQQGGVVEGVDQLDLSILDLDAIEAAPSVELTPGRSPSVNNTWKGSCYQSPQATALSLNSISGSGSPSEDVGSIEPPQ
jgi:hypothetical protein